MKSLGRRLKSETIMGETGRGGPAEGEDPRAAGKGEARGPLCDAGAFGQADQEGREDLLQVDSLVERRRKVPQRCTWEAAGR
jgi:hypothetical protein